MAEHNTERDEVEAAARRFLDAWDEFDGPPLTVQDTYNAVAEHVEGLRSALDSVRQEGAKMPNRQEKPLFRGAQEPTDALRALKRAVRKVLGGGACV